MSRIGEEIRNGLFLRKVGGFLCCNVYKALCPSCGKEFTKRIWFSGKRRTLRMLARHFNSCSECGKYVCDDCYMIIAYGQLNEGICLDCAKKRGITGLTTTEYLNGVSLSDKRNQFKESKT